MKKHLLFLGTFLVMTKLLAMEANWIALNINGTAVYTLDGKNFIDAYGNQIHLQIVYPLDEIELYKDNIPLGYEALDGETEVSNVENSSDEMPYDNGFLLGYSPLDPVPSDNEKNKEEEQVSEITREKRDFKGDGVLNFKPRTNRANGISQRPASRPVSIIVPKKEFNGGGVLNFKKGTDFSEKNEFWNIFG